MAVATAIVKVKAMVAAMTTVLATVVPKFEMIDNSEWVQSVLM